MPAPIDVRRDFTPDQLRDIADGMPDRSHARRLRAIAAIIAGKTRAEAASIGGMERQTLRDWVHRFNAEGPAGLKNLRPPGRPPKLTAAQQSELAAIVAKRPEAHGRWRLADLVRIIRDRFGIDHDEVSVGRIMKKLGYAYNGAEWRLSSPTRRDASDDDQGSERPGQRTASPSVPRPWAETFVDC